MGKKIPQVIALVQMILVLLGSLSLQATEKIDELAIYQQTTVEGKVVSAADEIPLSGVSVFEKGTENGTVTDFNGNYSLAISDPNAILVFSYLGFQTQEIPVNGESIISVTLEDDVSQLDEMVLVGYTSQKERTITGALTSVNLEDLESRRVPNVTQALQGQVAGVNITQSTGAPGADVEVRIRGNGTIGNNNPLYVIDGVPSRDISFLNPNDIKSMTVLKDASAASIYGSRAAGGVIVIETKIGSQNKGVQANFFTGIQRVTNLPNLLNAEQYIETVEQAWNNAGYEGVNPYTADRNRADFADVDYLDELFELGKTYSAQLTAAGGNENTNYFLSAGYYGQNGAVVYDNDKYRRLSLRSNINSNLSERLTVGANLQLSHEYQDRISSRGDSPGIIRHAFLRPPIIPVFKDPMDPTFSEEDPFTDLPFYIDRENFESNKYEYSQNPIALAYFTDDSRRNFRTFGNIFAEYGLLKSKELKLRTNFGADINFLHNKAFNENFGDDDGGGASLDRGLGRQNRPNSLSEVRGEDMTFTWNNTLSYSKTFDDHTLDALVGSEFITSRISTLNASRTRFDFTQPNFRYIDFGDTEQDIWNGGLAEEWSLFSYFGSITYSFQRKYMLTANFRADASSRFAEENKWGYFPSMSAGWMISEEDFMNDVDWLTELKIRGSWGQLGNQEIPNFAFLTLYRRDADRYLINRYGNPDLKWETSTQTNFGIDYGFLKNRLYGSIDYFIKETSDILLPISLPQVVGDVAPTFLNAGEVTNSGWEFGLTYRNSDNVLKYQMNFNLASLNNEVNSLHPNLPYIDGIVTRTQPGRPLNSYYGYIQEGIYQNEEEIAEHLTGTPNPPQQPGDIKFMDLNEDGRINDSDRDFIGNPNPETSYGFSGSMSYKSFDFNFLFQGVEGVDRFNDLKKIIDYDTRPFNYTDRVLNAWDGEGSTNVIPRVSFTDNGSSRISDIYVEDASYLRLKNVELGYSLNINKLIDSGNVRFYVSGQNLFTITEYTGLDPESTDLIDYGTYPQSLTILFGINASL